MFTIISPTLVALSAQFSKPENLIPLAILCAYTLGCGVLINHTYKWLRFFKDQGSKIIRAEVAIRDHKILLAVYSLMIPLMPLLILSSVIEPSAFQFALNKATGITMLVLIFFIQQKELDYFKVRDTHKT